MIKKLLSVENYWYKLKYQQYKVPQRFISNLLEVSTECIETEGTYTIMCYKSLKIYDFDYIPPKKPFS